MWKQRVIDPDFEVPLSCESGARATGGIPPARAVSISQVAYRTALVVLTSYVMSRRGTEWT
jgi:hypothetical protein